MKPPRQLKSEIQDAGLAHVFHIMVAAHRGDQDRLAPLVDAYDEQAPVGFFDILINAWIGRRDAANQAAAEIDEHYLVPWSCGRRPTGVSAARPGISKRHPTLPPRSKRPT